MNVVFGTCMQICESSWTTPERNVGDLIPSRHIVVFGVLRES